MSTHELTRRREQPGAQPGEVQNDAVPTGVIAVPVPVAGVARRSAPVTEDPLGGSPISADLADTLRRRRGTGAPLPTDVAERFGEQFGADLSGVRVHADAEADQISRSVQATAFTHGTDVYFTQGSYAPHSQSGQHLLAHELAHVTQQDGGSGSAAVIGRADDPAEAAADATATRVLGALRRRAAAPQATTAAEAATQGDGVVRRFTTARPKRRRPLIGGHRGEPSRTGPVLGTHRGAPRPVEQEAKESERGEVDPYNNIEEFQAERPTNAYSYSPEQQEAKESEHEEDAYNNAEEFSAERPRNAYSYSPEQQEAKESENEEDSYNNIEEFQAERPRHAYGQRIDAPNEVGSEPNYVEVPEVGSQEAKESEGEEDAYNNADEFQAQAPQQGSYSEVPELSPRRAQNGAGAPQVQAPQVQAPQVQAPQVQAPQVQAPQVQAPQQVPQGAPGPREPVPVGGKKRHAWVVSQLSSAYSNEEGASKQELASAIEPQVKLVGLTWRALQPLKSAAPGSEEAARQAALGVVQVQNPELHDKIKNLDFEALRKRLNDLHFRCFEGLKRQDFPIHENGDIDMPRMPNGDLDLSARKVKYDRGDEQEKSLITLQGGKLVRGPKADKPGPVDTADSVTHFSGPGYEIFVVSPDNELHMASHKIGAFHHSSLLAGADVALGGELKVKGGKIEAMSNKSGHYMPGVAQFQQFLHFLKKDGLDLDFPVTGFGVRAGLTAQQLHDGIDEDGDVDEEKTYHARKLRAVWKGYREQYDEDALQAAITAKGWTGDEDGVEDQNDDVVDPKLVIKALKEHFAHHAYRKQRSKRGPTSRTDVSWG